MQYVACFNANLGRLIYVLNGGVRSVVVYNMPFLPLHWQYLQDDCFLAQT